jgi:putative endonuclease
MDLPLAPPRGRSRVRADRKPQAPGVQLSLDLLPPPDPKREKRHAGLLSYCSGMAAEDQVARLYERRGAHLVARRWRGGGGELDLVFMEGERCVFVEVKRARLHDWALERIRPRQIARIFAAATVFMDGMPKRGLTDSRFDVATVDGTGEIRILENAFV